jgi:hypothetical protein
MATLNLILNRRDAEDAEPIGGFLSAMSAPLR